MDWRAFGLAAGLCLAMILAEGALSGKELHRWLASLKRPRFFAPLWLWVVAAVLTYLIQGAIAYRLLLPATGFAETVALVLLVAVMSANIAYNVVLDRLRSPRFAYSGIVWFVPLVAALQIPLLFADRAAAVLNLIYVAWVVGYDLPIMRALWKLNR